jgi:hypothetical protein
LVICLDADLLNSLLILPRRSPVQLEAENVVLRHQLNVVQRTASRKPKLTNLDRLIFVWLYRWFRTSCTQ